MMGAYLRVTTTDSVGKGGYLMVVVVVGGGGGLICRVLRY